MSLTGKFIKTQRRHPDWSYRELAEFLGTGTNVLRGINARLKPPLPIPTRFKAPKGQARSKRQRRLDRLNQTITLPELIETKKKAVKRELFVPPAMTGSGRKHYGGYLKLL